MNVGRGEKLRRFGFLLQSQLPLGNSLEVFTRAERPVNNFVFVAEIQQRVDASDLTIDGGRAPSFRPLRPVFRKVNWTERRKFAAFSKVSHEAVAHLFVFSIGAAVDVLGFERLPFRFYERIAERRHIVVELAFVTLVIAAGKNAFLAVQPFSQRGVGIVPRSEVVDTPLDLPAPLAALVRCQWIVGTRL